MKRHIPYAACLVFLAGFLLLNLRTPWRARAAIFMGDGGSMMLGIILGWLYLWTGSLLFPILLHAGVNFLNLRMLLRRKI